MVNPKKRDILERYRHFLENNLILTEEFLRWFEEKRILPSFIFDEIKVCQSRQRISKKLSLIRCRF